MSKLVKREIFSCQSVIGLQSYSDLSYGYVQLS
jgi:hypothetical protein